MGTRYDLVLAEKALRGRWPMSDEMRRALVMRALSIAATDHDRNALAAIRTLATLDGLSLRDEEMRLLREIHAQLTRASADEVPPPGTPGDDGTEPAGADTPTP